MSRGFMRGILYGGILGAIVAAFTVPQMKPMRKMKVLMGTSKKMGKNMRRMYKGVKGGIDDIID